MNSRPPEGQCVPVDCRANCLTKCALCICAELLPLSTFYLPVGKYLRWIFLSKQRPDWFQPGSAPAISIGWYSNRILQGQTTHDRGDSVDLDGDCRCWRHPVMVVAYKVCINLLVVLGKEDGKLCLVSQIFEYTRHKQLMKLQTYGCSRKQQSWQYQWSMTDRGASESDQGETQ